MKLECTKQEWAGLESILIDTFGQTRTVYENGTFSCRVVDESGEIVYHVEGKFADQKGDIDVPAL